MPAIDPELPPSSFRRSLTKVALSAPGTWFYSRIAARIDPWLARATRGRVTSAMGMLPIVLLTARGARSGLERTVALVYFTDGEDVILIASSFGRPSYPAWYHNLKANPEARLEAMGRAGRYVAREVEGAERERLYDLAKRLYSGYGDYEQRASGIRHVPVLRLSSSEQ
ncbi:MAG TPA: nitroreductase/quinone reductase family protein [Solirubrobacteraceae bacterium]|jgi:deazaflavin-dependent oxidoreductase (nitroreductase family)